jgi:hypothetical protein
MINPERARTDLAKTVAKHESAPWHQALRGAKKWKVRRNLGTNAITIRQRGLDLHPSQLSRLVPFYLREVPAWTEEASWFDLEKLTINRPTSLVSLSFLQSARQIDVFAGPYPHGLPANHLSGENHLPGETRVVLGTALLTHYPRDREALKRGLEVWHSPVGQKDLHLGLVAVPYSQGPFPEFENLAPPIVCSLAEEPGLLEDFALSLPPGPSLTEHFFSSLAKDPERSESVLRRFQEEPALNLGNTLIPQSFLPDPDSQAKAHEMRSYLGRRHLSIFLK